MNLYIDGSGVTVVDRDTGRRVAIFEHSKYVDGRAEARRYVACRVIAEAGQELLRASAAQDAEAALGAADLLKCAMEGADLPFDPEDLDAMRTLQERTNDSAGATDTSATNPPPARRKAGKRATS